MSGYDERLLAAAPAATREQKQDSYNINLLNTESNSAPDEANHASNAPLASNHDHAEAGIASKESFQPYPKRQLPWYRTKKWIIIFVILGIVVVAAVVGGAVGGTVGHHKNNNNAAAVNPGGAGGAPDAPSASSPAASGGGVPIAPASSSSGSDDGLGGASATSSTSSSSSSGDLGLGAAPTPTSSHPPDIDGVIGEASAQPTAGFIGIAGAP